MKKVLFVLFAAVALSFSCTKESVTGKVITGNCSFVEDTVRLSAWCNVGEAPGAFVTYGFEFSCTDLLTEATTVWASGLDKNNRFHCDLTFLARETQYEYRAFALKNGVRSYGKVRKFVTSGVLPSVDLGLSVRWAACNIGAAFPEDYGYHYAWGEIEAKQEYSWKTYKWWSGVRTFLSKYNTLHEYGFVDYKRILDPEDDVAQVTIGGKWRMPTKEEFEELCSNCERQWTFRNGVAGMLFTSKKNGKSIFLPSAGYSYEGNTWTGKSYGGSYWSSSLDEENPECAYTLLVSSSHYLLYGFPRVEGISVRPVMEK